jgi:hypothetical protein
VWGLMVKKWALKVRYRSRLGAIDVDFELDDIAELQTVIEQGPPDETVFDMTLIRRLSDAVTLESAFERMRNRSEEDIKAS